MRNAQDGVAWRDMREVPFRASRLMRALSNPKAYALILLLRERREMDVGEIADGLGRGISGVSKILRTLRDLNVVRYQKAGARTMYRLKHPKALLAIMKATEAFVLRAEEGLERAC